MHPILTDYAEQFAVFYDYAPVLFGFAHLMLFIRDILQLSRRRDTTIYLLMSSFSASRCIMFLLRTLPLYHLRALRRWSIVITNSGTSSALYAAYTLVLKRDAATGPDSEQGFWATANRLRRNRSIVLAALLYCIFLRLENTHSVTHSFWLMQQLDRKHQPHHKADGPLYIMVSLLLLLQTCILLRHEISRAKDRVFDYPTSRLVVHLFAIITIALSLFTRSIFSTVVRGGEGPSPANTAAVEASYYAFAALPELLAAALVSVNGLVPLSAGLHL
ncbi:hypothetical protein OE88DRAFT_1665549 [Heliocybe sulcata]|uniref:Uncharacterized protein n=1 Tax=Heliocybe sulcata TaxID=5364 RepID=A0A5C3MSK2_9AGAM|nr:hypothetical protein OE88DRAFT_1665549 [Heliocybe sulcata]